MNTGSSIRKSREQLLKNFFKGDGNIIPLNLNSVSKTIFLCLIEPLNLILRKKIYDKHTRSQD